MSAAIEARRLADAERATGLTPPGCEYLDPQTVDDLDMPLVFSSINRTDTVTGAQALWRWLVAPVTDRATLEARESMLQQCSSPELQRAASKVLAKNRILDSDAEYLPELLWQPLEPLKSAKLSIAFFAALMLLIVGVIITPTAIVPLLLVAAGASVYNVIAEIEVARHAHSLTLLASVLDTASRLSRLRELPAELRGTIDADLRVYPRLSRALALLTVNDPFGIIEMLRNTFQLRTLAVRRALKVVAAEREALRRIVLWVGELDAALAMARVRRDRRDVSIPSIDGAVIQVGGLVHPGLKDAVGNDIIVTAGLLITGSNASGKSTFLRAIAINAVLAQSVRFTFGTWRAPLMRVRTAMRIHDDIELGMSTYAAEVAAIGKLVHAAADRSLPILYLLDEPFHGTNPAVRVPIVVSVLEHLADGHFVLAATHDLDVANQASARFERFYFTELDAGVFDRKIKAGIAPSSNAYAMLERAGYPLELLSRIEQRQRAS